MHSELSPSENRARVLDMIREDMERDVTALEGQPFTGQVIAPAIGRLAAAIYALAGIIKEADR